MTPITMPAMDMALLGAGAGEELLEGIVESETTVGCTETVTLVSSVRPPAMSAAASWVVFIYSAFKFATTALASSMLVVFTWKATSTDTEALGTVLLPAGGGDGGGGRIVEFVELLDAGGDGGGGRVELVVELLAGGGKGGGEVTLLALEAGGEGGDGGGGGGGGGEGGICSSLRPLTVVVLPLGGGLVLFVFVELLELLLGGGLVLFVFVELLVDMLVLFPLLVLFEPLVLLPALAVALPVTLPPDAAAESMTLSTMTVDADTLIRDVMTVSKMASSAIPNVALL